MKMVNVTTRITTLALLKAKFSEVKNELLRGHASNIAGLPPKRRENENDPTLNSQSGAASGSGRSQSSLRSYKHQGVFDKNKETLKCNRCGHNAGKPLLRPTQSIFVLFLDSHFLSALRSAFGSE